MTTYVGESINVRVTIIWISSILHRQEVQITTKIVNNCIWIIDITIMVTSYYIHTYICLFNGPFSRTTRVSRYQKGKTNLDFTEARDSELQWHQLGHVHLHFTPDR